MALVVVPAKPLARAKARLASVLAPDERRALSLAMLSDVCAAAVASGHRVVVVASDTEAESAARGCGADAVADPTPDAGLNPSLEAAIDPDGDGTLVLASDLPACSPDDVAAMIGGEGVRLAPDASGSGTNALWRRPHDAIPLAFGDGSAAAHRSLAARRGVPFTELRRPGLALDVDTPSDLKDAWDAALGPQTRAALSAMGFPGRAI